jgi:hypothetical protein
LAVVADVVGCGAGVKAVVGSVAGAVGSVRVVGVTGAAAAMGAAVAVAGGVGLELKAVATAMAVGALATGAPLGGWKAPSANRTASSSGIRPMPGASHHQRQARRSGTPRPE